MPKENKSGKWAYSVKRYLTDSYGKYQVEGVIYLNLKDATDDDKVLREIAHEASHLLENEDFEETKEKVYQFLRAYIDKLT